MGEPFGYTPTPEQQAVAEAVMTNEQRVSSNAMYEALEPFTNPRLEIPPGDVDVIKKHAQRYAEIKAEEYRENAMKVENSPGMMVIKALESLESLDGYKGPMSAAAESIRDAARVWE